MAAPAPAAPVSCPAEDSPSGLGRTLGKRVGVQAPQEFESLILRHIDQAIHHASRTFDLGLQGCVVSFVVSLILRISV